MKKKLIKLTFFLDGEDDITSLAEADIGVDRNTQKRRYSRLSDGYERLKSVLPSVKDKRRVSKVFIAFESELLHLASKILRLASEIYVVISL